jgi:hypothetical protein
LVGVDEFCTDHFFLSLSAAHAMHLLVTHETTCALSESLWTVRSEDKHKKKRVCSCSIKFRKYMATLVPEGDNDELGGARYTELLEVAPCIQKRAPVAARPSPAPLAAAAALPRRHRRGSKRGHEASGEEQGAPKRANHSVSSLTSLLAAASISAPAASVPRSRAPKRSLVATLAAASLSEPPPIAKRHRHAAAAASAAPSRRAAGKRTHAADDAERDALVGKRTRR